MFTYKIEEREGGDGGVGGVGGSCGEGDGWMSS